MLRTHRALLIAGPLVLATLAVAALPGIGTAQTYVAGPASAPVPLWDRDARTLAATAEVPTFGGSYVADDGTLHVWLTRPDTADAQRTRTALKAVAGTGPTPVVHRADYTFAQLVAWRDASRQLLALPGVTMLDLDERANRLVLSVEDTGRDGPAVTAGLARLGVPRAAVTLAQAGPVTQTQSLSDEARPLRGGVKLRWNAGYCTLGFMAQRAGVNGFVTNSHCSVTSGAVDSGKYWQPEKTDDTKIVGTETADPAFSTASPCPAGRKCRKSDANFVAAAAGVGLGQGTIARPALDSTAWNGVDTFRIVGVRDVQIPTKVQKVGQVTGRTAGAVTADCLDLPVKNTTITLFCQDMASYTAQDGDSGSPVFEIVNEAANTVALAGIHWGIGTNSLGQPRTFYSPFSSIEAELGNLNVCSDPTVC